MTVYWLVWDGAAHWIVDRLVTQGALPHTARLRARGLWGAARPPAPNCQTPPSLATLFTGTWPQQHQVTGFQIPGAAGVGAADTAFAPGRCAAPTVWQTAARAGLRTATVHVPWTFAADGQADTALDAAVEAYSRRHDRHALIRIEGRRQHADVGPFRLTVDAEPYGAGRRELTEVSCGGRSVTLHARDARWRPLRLGNDSGIWLRTLRVGGEWLLLRTGAWRLRAGGRDTDLAGALARLPVFAGESLGSVYRAGELGPRLVDGGDGTAEDLLLSSTARVHASFAAAADLVLRRHSADLVIVYLPTTDDLGHDLAGWCDPHSAAHRPDVAGQVWQRIARGYGLADRLLGEVMRRADADDTVLLTADHGIAGTAWTVHPNEALIAAGLAARAADGGLDPHRSAVVYHPANNGSLWVNHQDLPGGYVHRAAAAALLDKAEAALRTLTDPRRGRPVTAGFRTSPGADPETVRHILFDPDCLPAATLRPDGRALAPSPKPGGHVTNSGDPRLHAVFAAAGPGLEPGTELGTVDNTEPARIALHQLERTARATRPRPETTPRNACTAI
ncbi:alkaline phosphatase family protein [Streptomyces sp. NBC_01136]|uniref:alkaline phosphatase family protein n=1 Tax=unclassified Streptomyces TaxID=2593676 RepID=UPI003249005D|nr:alkaline phosphatase family protein [Streptomyces sp. NBC_01136]